MDQIVENPIQDPNAAIEPPSETEVVAKGPVEISVRSLLGSGAHFGHQTRRWDPRMKNYIFGERHGIHILDLDVTYRRMSLALDFVREKVASGGKVLFVGTKRQAQAPIKMEAERSSQFYVNNRWLGGMLTNFRTVKKSIETFKGYLDILDDEERLSELSKKELSRLNRTVIKYRKSLDGIREMSKLPDVLFIIDVNKEHIALTEARRLGIPVVAVVDTNCNPEGIDFVIPGNDDAIRAIQLYCAAVSDACLAGAEIHNARIESEVNEQETGRPQKEISSGRRVVDMKKQAPRRSPGTGGTHSAESEKRGRGRGGEKKVVKAPKVAARRTLVAAPEETVPEAAAPEETAPEDGNEKPAG